MKNEIIVSNCSPVNLENISGVPIGEFQDKLLKLCGQAWRIVNYFAVPDKKQSVNLFAVLAHDANGKLNILSSEKIEKDFPSLTPDCIQAHLFEREIAEKWNIIPENHPWLKPVRLHRPQNPTVFLQAQSEEIHEVAVGPVHAGIIEPGHFRFQCSGEKVLNLEISLGYQHRGIEKALIGGPDLKTIHYIETSAGDTTIGHTLAYVQAVEAFADCSVSARAQTLRGIMLELERLANHTGDLGALANDIGYLPTASYCGRIRGDFLNLTALICGNRFGRNMICPGGVRFDLDKRIIGEFLKRLEKIFADLTNAVELLWNTPSVMDRFEGAGKISRETGEKLGLVGIPARACGIMRDIRFDFPSGIYRLAQLPVSTYNTGDVFARAYTRWLEIQKSVEFINNQCKSLPAGETKISCGSLVHDTMVVSLTEGWRGEICHTAITDEKGSFKCYKIVDPSFHNWTGLEMALRNEQISNFPLCNKSFNLSYCGHDL
ncbi:hydrogenase [bacterium]|nr:hydrogenase [bacterium]